MLRAEDCPPEKYWRLCQQNVHQGVEVRCVQCKIVCKSQPTIIQQKLQYSQDGVPSCRSIMKKSKEPFEHVLGPIPCQRLIVDVHMTICHVSQTLWIMNIVGYILCTPESTQCHFSSRFVALQNMEKYKRGEYLCTNSTAFIRSFIPLERSMRSKPSDLAVSNLRCQTHPVLKLQYMTLLSPLIWLLFTDARLYADCWLKSTR